MSFDQIRRQLEDNRVWDFTAGYFRYLEQIFHLDSTTHDLVFSCLSPLELYRLSRTSRAMYTHVSDYRRRAHNIAKLLEPFFSNPDAFRALQARTGTLISGSQALQFFDRTIYDPNADLDIYVEHRYALEVAQFLVAPEQGYEFQPRPKQSKDFLKTMAKVLSAVEGGRPRPAPYYIRGIADVYDFKRGDKKIQLITARRMPLSIILQFHSTCVINVITHANAYALYPHSTFCDREALVVPTTGTDQDAARQKYVNRGWRMIEKISLPDETSAVGTYGCPGATEFVAGDRYVGDDQTWVIPLGPIQGVEATPDVLPLNAWALIPKGVYHEPEMAFEILDDPRLRYRTAFTRSSFRLMKVAWTCIPRAAKYWDAELCEVMQKFHEAGRGFGKVVQPVRQRGL